MIASQDLLEHGKAFRGFARRHDDTMRRHSGSGQRRLRTFQYVTRDVCRR